MTATITLRTGWLEEDMKRASKRVAQWEVERLLENVDRLRAALATAEAELIVAEIALEKMS